MSENLVYPQNGRFFPGEHHAKPWDVGVPVFRQTHLRQDV